MANHKSVLLTGVTGFLGSHTTIQLLEKGYNVRGTLRDMNRVGEITRVIGEHTANTDKLSFAEADLTDAGVWDNLTKEMDYVLHIASPFPRELPDHEDDLIVPAQKGTLNLLKAAATNFVKRVVLTSSTGAIVFGKAGSRRRGTFTETDWTDITVQKDCTPYFKSKTIAEKSAWEFMEENGGEMELASICPGAILGPVLEKDFGTSANIVIKVMDGSMPAIPNIGFDIVDVRSVADLHIRAMETPQAAGQRFIGSAGYLSFKNVAEILRKHYPGRKIPKRTLPDFAVRWLAKIDKTLQPVLVNLSAERKTDNSKARRLLKWNPISTEEAALACARSLLALEIV